MRTVILVALSVGLGCGGSNDRSVLGPSGPPSTPVDEESAACDPTNKSTTSLLVFSKPFEETTELPTPPVPLQNPTVPAWTSGRRLAAHGGELFAVDMDNGHLVVLEQSSLAVLRTIPVGVRPEQVVVSSGGVAFVSVVSENRIARVEAGAASATGVSQKSVGMAPYGLALAPDESVLYVALMGEGLLLALDPATLDELDRIHTLDTPVAVAAVPGGRVVVSHLAAGALVVVTEAGGGFDHDAADESVPFRTANPWDRTLFRERLVGVKATRGFGAAVHPQTGDVFVTHMLGQVGTQEDLMAGHATPPGQPSTGGSGEGTEKPPPSSGGGGYFGGSSVNANTIVRLELPDLPRVLEMSVTRVAVGPNSPGGATETDGFPVVFADNGQVLSAKIDQPSDVHHHPSWSLLFITGEGTDNVIVLNSAVSDPMRAPLAVFDVGWAPRGIAFSDDGTRAYVLNSQSFGISEIDVTPLLELPRIGKGVQPLRGAHLREETYGTNPLDTPMKAGRRAFTHAGSSRLVFGGRFACSTCHPDGMEDKQVWFVPDGPRNTLSLAHRLRGTEPFNWRGTEDTLAANFSKTIARIGGTGLTCSEEEGMRRYVLDGFPPVPSNPHLSADGSLTEAQARGKEIFEDPQVGCALCHNGDQFTDGQVWDVGTTELERLLLCLRDREEGDVCDPKWDLPPAPLNTPSLRGLYYTAPFLHDGSAGNLFDVLDMTATTMGYTAELSEEEKTDLVAYLLTL